MLKIILLGDVLASEFVLLNMLAKPYQRQDGFLLGNYSINLSGMTIPMSRSLLKFIQAVLPLTLYMPLTIDNLDKDRYTPRKNYDTNLLEPGLFQMVDSTFVLTDELWMKEGQVKDNGLNNIKAIATLIEQQTVNYDFQYYQQEMPINAGVMVISDGRSMFKNTQQVIVQVEEGRVFDEAKFTQILADHQLMTQMRRYFLVLQYHSMTSLQEYSIPAEVSEYCQNIFIETRKAEQEALGEVKTNADTFHKWLSLSRLMAVSDGEITLS